MKISGLLTACIVLAALLGLLYWSNHHPSTADSAVKASADTPPKILSLDQPNIASIAIHRKDEPALDLSRNSSGTWQITSPKPLTADQESVSSVLSTVSSLHADRLLEDKASNLGSYGLASPPLEVDVTMKDNKTQKLLVGDKTPSGNAFYAVLAGDPRLFTIASYDKTSLDKTANDLRDKRLLTADFDKVSQIELLNQTPDKKQDITFARDKDAWQILKPGPFRTQSFQVDDLIRALKDAKMQAEVGSDDAKNAAAFKSATPFAVAKITGASGTQELQIRKSKDNYYAQSTALPGVYQVPSTVATSLNKSIDDFRNKKLFDFGYQDPNKIELHDGAKSYVLTHSATDWSGSDGKKLDDSTVQALLGDLRDLAAVKFPESGFSSPAIQIIVTSNDNKRVERVSIAKSGDNYIAKLENEPALYELSSSSVQELQKSAANLKPAEPPKK
jgi:hypothetical protein